jgi:glycosyltransferase involved in cell wall biosynthesis
MATTKSRQKLLVVIPAYNAATQIKHVVKSIPKQIECQGRVFETEVAIVEDGSKDATYEEALKTRATVLKHVMNSGAGAATRTGLKYAESLGEEIAYVVTIDSDGQHNSDDIERLLACALRTSADFVVGNRLHSGNSATMPLHRVLGNKGLTLISRLLFGIKVEDTQSGLRLYAADKLRFISNYTIDRYGFCTESLWLATRSKLNIQEVPIEVSYSDETLSHGQNNWGVVDLLLDLLWIRMVG